MTALLDRLTDHHLAKKLAKLLVPHHHNNHHPYLIRHESLFAITVLIVAIQFFSSGNISSAHVLGYATNITKEAIISLTNQERVASGVAPLTENAKLNTSAALKNQHMFAHDYWAHYSPDGTSPWYFFKQAGYNYSWAGENLARDFSTAEGVVNGWMNSPSHRENMLNPNFTDIGIGVGNGILQGSETTLVVQHLGKALGASTNNTNTSGVGSSSSGSSNSSSKAFQGQPSQVEASLTTPVEKTTQPVAAANVNQVNEKIASATKNTFNFTSFWNSMGLGQKLTLALLGLLVSVFTFDSIMLFHKEGERKNSHSLLHASVLLILMVTLVKSALGAVL